MQPQEIHFSAFAILIVITLQKFYNLLKHKKFNAPKHKSIIIQSSYETDLSER